MAEQPNSGGVVYGDELGHKEISGPQIFIQWKGTDVCLDFHCECGAHHHVDADFVYALQCGSCGRFYDMPNTIALKPIEQPNGCFHRCEPDPED